ncbi:hypothetical protein [Neptuniibacter marinus]|uniref:hypothetical protein n=1 Tax=Neptuniibacter marinus TaxID=1806670 RepID=UPI003B58BD8A
MSDDDKNNSQSELKNTKGQVDTESNSKVPARPTISDLTKDNVKSATFSYDRVILPLPNRPTAQSDLRTLTIEVPTRYQNNEVIRSIIDYLNSSSFKNRKASDTYYHRVHEFLKDLFQELLPQNRNTTATLGFDYLSLLKRRERSEKVIYAKFMYGHALFSNILSPGVPQELALTIDVQRDLAAVQHNWPYLTEPPKKPKPSIADEFDLDYSNKQYIESIRRFGIHYLKTWREIRTSFKHKMPNEYNFLLRLYKDPEQRKLLEESFSGSSAARNSDTNRSIYKRFLKIYLAAALKLDSDELLELVFFCSVVRNNKGHNYHSENAFNPFADCFNESRDAYTPLCTKEFMINTLERYFRRDKEVKASACYPYTGSDKYKKRAFVLGTFPPISILIFPSSFVERLVFGWILASERHQLSNLTKATLRSIQITDKLLRVETFKGRSKKTEGATYKKTHPLYQTIKNYYEDTVNAYVEGWLSSSDSFLDSKLLPNFQTMNVPFFRGAPKGVLLAPFSVTNSLSSNMLKNIEGNYAHPILDAIRYWYNHNSIYASASGGSTKATRPKGAQRKSISIGHVAQSAVYAELGSVKEHVRLSDNMSVNFAEELDKDRAFKVKEKHHSIGTRLNIYSDRSTDKVKIENEYIFASLVGEEMLKTAASIAEYKYNHTSVITLDEAKKICGIMVPDHIELSAEELIEQAGIQDFLVDVTGLIQDKAETYIIQSPIAAALITAYIEHIDNNLDDLFCSNEALGRSILAQRMFLQMLLNSAFDPKLIREANEQYGHYQFPFPSLNL